ncbi:DUF4181 domain-containing protein [Saliterribacillus persicus]|uniref:Uncharacterized protein DUF4181 n=1 Tax=Saliterribacillus persicus TaxID=930114 RepID=A0A368Y334_9BACI|nr:DUF4181 domain-containing protein [Saliterribacillus persicus]RCW73237.1 uncharacterized protein DUF4181 [Saliterribacillus persicus]
MFYIDSELLWKAGFVLVSFGILLYMYNNVMRHWLKVEKKKLFSYNHINKQHKIIDWAIRITFMFLLLLSYTYKVSVDFRNVKWYLEIWFVMIVFVVVLEGARAYMEWKFAENRRDYIFTISQLIFIILFFSSMILTDFFWMMPR